MKFHTATLVASSCSAITLIVSLMVMAHIYVSVQDFWNELDTEIVDFRVRIPYSLSMTIHPKVAFFHSLDEMS